MQLLNNTKPYVYITPEVKLKMDILVQQSDKEVGWHGLVKRSGMTFVIYDILLFPQKVTGATVTPDEKEYYDWLDTLKDEQINDMRFHGHSHVNMGVNPSAVDMRYRTDMMANTEDYYIFMIVNKKGIFEISVYDKITGLLFEEDDVVVKIGTPASFTDAATWVSEETKKYVKEAYKCSTTLNPSKSSRQQTGYGINKYTSSELEQLAAQYPNYYRDWD